MQPRTTPVVIPLRPSTAWALAALLFAGGLAVGGFYNGALNALLDGFGVQGGAHPAGRLEFLPSLDPTFETALSTRLAGQFAPGSLLPGVLLGILAAFGFLASEVLVRRAFHLVHPVAAALPWALLLAAPAWGGAVRFKGLEGVLAGGALGAIGGFVATFGRTPALLIGSVCAGLAAGLHPLWAALIPAVIFCARTSTQAVRGTVAGLSAVVALVIAGAIWWTHPTPAPVAGVVPAPWPLAERLGWAWRDVLAAPVYALVPWRRYDIPTGYYPLVTSAPVVLGATLHAIVFGVGMMISGIRRGAAAAICAIVSVVLAAVVVPGQIPGVPTTLIGAPICWLPLLGVTLSVLKGPRLRPILLGLCLAGVAIAVLSSHGRAPGLTQIGAAVSFPREHDQLSGRDVPAFAIEDDPARLCLFAAAAPRGEPYAGGVIDRILLLLDAGRPCLNPAHLRAIVEERGRMIGRPVQRSPEFLELASGVGVDLDIVRRLMAEDMRGNFPAACRALVDTVPRLLDLYYRWPREMETAQHVQLYRKNAEALIPVASRAGYYEFAIPLRESMQHLNPPDAEADAVIAIQRTLGGDLAAGQRELLAVLPKLPAKGVIPELSRGMLGLIYFWQGNPAKALPELNRAWSTIGAGGVKNVVYTYQPDAVDFYLVAEILLARYESAREVDRDLVQQCEKDLVELLKAPLTYGVRRVPAIAMMGRISFLAGRRAEGLGYLREARAIPINGLDDRSDGPRGRIGNPRYRRMALTWLRDALTDEADRHERAEVEAELQSLPN